MNLEQLIITVGYLGLFSVIFAESGLLIGIVFPGDSVLFTAGFLASQGIFDISILVLGCFAAAVLGDNVGYAFGKRVGKRFFTREKSFFFRPENVTKAQEFYARYGGKTIILARFLPGVRTLAPILAGVGDMRYSMFLTYNLAGGLLWAVGVTLLGYFLGSVIPGADKYLLPIVGVVIIASVLPSFWKIIVNKEHRNRFKEGVRQAWQNRR